MTAVAVFGLLITLILLGVPIAVSMGLAAIVVIWLMGGTDLLIVLPQRMYSATTSFPLLAIPFFILAGNLMNTGGMTRRIFGFAQLLVGRIQGGLAHVNVVASMIFAGMSGSAPGRLVPIRGSKHQPRAHGRDRQGGVALFAGAPGGADDRDLCAGGVALVAPPARALK